MSTPSSECRSFDSALNIAGLAPTIIFRDGAVTRDELLTMVSRGAEACAQLPPGDIQLAAENRPGTIALWLGSMLAGKRVFLVNPDMPTTAIEKLRRPHDVALVSGPSYWLDREYPHTARAVLPLEEVEDGGPADFLIEHTTKVSGSTILATSGTTGASKLVEWRWPALQHAAQNMAMVGRYSTDDVIVTSLPLFHANALLVVVLAGIVAGSTVAIDHKFSARRFSQTMRRYDANKTSLLGSMAQLILEKDEERPTAVERMIVAPCTAVTADKLHTSYGASVAQIYGQTDIGIVLWNDKVTSADSGCGIPLPGWEVTIDGDSGSDGDLMVRSMVAGVCASGYIDDDALTNRSRRDFWFHTGDIFSQVGDIYFYKGRNKDVLRTRGENVSCGEVEEVLRSVRGVTDAVVIGRPNRLGEDDVIAVVECDVPRLSVIIERIYDACQKQLSPHARPVGLAQMDSLPRTATEKISKELIDLDTLSIVSLDAPRQSAI